MRQFLLIEYATGFPLPNQLSYSLNEPIEQGTWDTPLPVENQSAVVPGPNQNILRGIALLLNKLQAWKAKMLLVRGFTRAYSTKPIRVLLYLPLFHDTIIY